MPSFLLQVIRLQTWKAFSGDVEDWQHHHHTGG